LWIWDRYRGCCGSEAKLLHDLDRFSRRESVVLSPSDPFFETLQSCREGPGIGISLPSVARDLRELERADRVAEVEADLSAAQREIDVCPRRRA